MSGPFSSPPSVLIIPVCEGPRCPPLMRRLVTRGAQRVLEVGEGHAWLQAPEGDEPPGAQPWVQAWRRPRSPPQPEAVVWLGGGVCGRAKASLSMLPGSAAANRRIVTLVERSLYGSWTSHLH